MDVSNITVKVFQDKQCCDQHRRTLEGHIDKMKREIIQLKDDLYSLKQTNNQNSMTLALNNFTKTAINNKCKTITHFLGELFRDVKEMKNRINHIADEDQIQINTYNNNKEICSKIKKAYEKNAESLEILHKKKESEIISNIKVIELEIEELNMLRKNKSVEINKKYENIAIIENELKEIADRLEIKRKEKHSNEELFKNKKMDNDNLIEDLEKSTEPIKNSLNKLQNNLQVLIHEVIKIKKNMQAIEHEISQLQSELQIYNNKCLVIENLLVDNSTPTNNLKLRKTSKIIKEHEDNYLQELETQNVIEKDIDDMNIKLKEVKNNETIEKENQTCIEIELSIKEDFEKISTEIKDLTLKFDELTKSVFEKEKELSLKNNELFRIRSTARVELKVAEEKIEQLDLECNSKCKLEDEMAVRATNKKIQENIADIKKKIEDNYKNQNKADEENLHLKTINMQIVNISNEITKLESSKQYLTPHPPFKAFLQPVKPVSHKRKIVEESDDSSVSEGEKIEKTTYKQFIAKKKMCKK